jgi:hypothetical protein
MSVSLTESARPVLVRAEDAEYLESIGHYLLADSSATGGALSSHRIALPRGADGAVPHRHDNSSEAVLPPRRRAGRAGRRRRRHRRRR